MISSFDNRPILSCNDPWHDSSFFLPEPSRQTHVESERFTRRKCECIDAMVFLCELFKGRIEAFRDIAVQVNAELGNYMHRLLLAKHGRDPSTSTLRRLIWVDDWLARGNPSQGRNETTTVTALSDPRRFAADFSKAVVSDPEVEFLPDSSGAGILVAPYFVGNPSAGAGQGSSSGHEPQSSRNPVPLANPIRHASAVEHDIQRERANRRDACRAMRA